MIFAEDNTKLWSGVRFTAYQVFEPHYVGVVLQGHSRRVDDASVSEDRWYL
jgi:hypothetical protein